MLSTLSKIKFVKSTTVAQARVLSTFRGSTAALSSDASYTTEAAADQPYLMTNSEAFVETMVGDDSCSESTSSFSSSNSLSSS